MVGRIKEIKEGEGIRTGKRKGLGRKREGWGIIDIKFLQYHAVRCRPRVSSACFSRDTDYRVAPYSNVLNI